LERKRVVRDFRRAEYCRKFEAKAGSHFTSFPRNGDITPVREGNITAVFGGNSPPKKVLK
jgi:hypothetical protein